MSARATTKRKTPWRDNIEALTVAIVMAVMLKYFIVEAYKIPTGSMQPTLMGSDETAIFDRILVDKLSFHYRDPERYEVVVFKYPLDRSKNFIKRIVGMPDEQLRIWKGDLWTRKSDADPWTVLRRPVPVQQEMLKLLNPAEDERVRWKPDNSQWTATSREVVARGAGRAKFSWRNDPSILDDYIHGYPPQIADMLRVPYDRTRRHHVGDLRVAGQVRASAECRSIAIELTEGPRTYVLEIPGPAADGGARPSLRARYADADSQSAKSMPAEAFGSPYRLPADQWIEFAGQNLDDELTLEIEGERVGALEVAQTTDNADTMWTTSAAIAQDGAGAEFEDLEAFRDVYYTSESKTTQVVIPAGNYFMLGDNTQDSSDSREWSFDCLRWPGEGSEGRVARGNRRFGENPVEAATELGDMTFFRDEWGELYVFPTRTRERVTPEQAPLVARELIAGRAVFVFWPLSRHGVSRLKWIH